MDLSTIFPVSRGHFLLLFGFWRELVLDVSVDSFREDCLSAVANCCFVNGGMSCHLPAAPQQLPGCSVLPHIMYCVLHMRHRESLPLAQGDLSVIPCYDLFSLMGCQGGHLGKNLVARGHRITEAEFFNGMGTEQRGSRGKYLKEKIRQTLLQFMKSVSCVQ